MIAHSLSKPSDFDVTAVVEAAHRSRKSMIATVPGDGDPLRSVLSLNLWEATRGGCLVLPEHHPTCPLTICRFHVQNELRAKALKRQVLGTDTCVLRAAEGNPCNLEAIGSAFGITRERARQIEMKALGRVCRMLARMGAISQGEVNPIWKAKHNPKNKKDVPELGGHG